MPVRTIEHDRALTTARFSPDGRSVLTASVDRAAARWDHEGTRVATFGPHLGAVRSAAFSPDGLTVVTASEDRGVRLWDAASGRLRALCKGHQSTVHDVAFSPDGALLASASNDGTVRVWTAAGEPARVLRRHPGGASALAWIPGDSPRLAVRAAEHVVVLWDVSDGARAGEIAQAHSLALVHGPSGGPALLVTWNSTARIHAPDGALLAAFEWDLAPSLAAAVSPDGTRIALGGAVDGSIQLRDARTGATLATLHGHTGAVRMLAFDGDGARLVSGAEDATARVWSVARGAALHELRGARDHVCSVAISPHDGGLALVAALDGAAQLHGLREAPPAPPPRRGCAPDGTAAPLAFLPHPRCAAAVFAPHGGIVTAGWGDASRGEQGAVRFWEDEREAALVPVGHLGRLAFSPAGDRLLAYGDYACVGVIDPTGPRLLWSAEEGRARFAAGRRTVLSVTKAGAVRVRDVDTGEVAVSMEPPPDGQSPSPEWWSPDDARVLLRRSGGRVAYLYDTTRGERCAELPSPRMAWFAPDGSVLALQAGEEIGLYDGRTGQRLGALRGRSAGMTGVAWLGGGRLATVDEDTPLRVWDARSGELLAALDANTHRFQSLTAAADGARLVAGAYWSWNVTARLFDPAGVGRAVASYRVRGGFASACFSPGGSRALLFSNVSPWESRVLLLIDPRDGREIAALGGHASTLASQAADRFHEAMFSPDEARVATTMWTDGRVRLWECDEGRLLAALGHDDDVRSMVFAADGRRLLTVGGAGARVWDAQQHDARSAD